MATAYEGEAIVGTDQIDYSANSSATLYTVPAGRYARIKFNKVAHIAGGATSIDMAGSLNFTLEIAVSFTADLINDPGFASEFILYSGDTISSTGGGADQIEVRASILEFANP